MPSSSDRFLAALQGQVGVPYQWGGDTPGAGFDCSGLVKWAAAQVGVELPHFAASQEAAATPLTRSATAPGDLVFFDGPPAGHVGVCLDAGCSQMIDAPHSGAAVRVETVWPGARFGRITGLSGGTDTPTTARLTAAQGGAPGPPGIGDLTDPAAFASKTAAWVIGQAVTFLTGGKTPAELAVRFLEVTAGAVLLGSSVVLIGLSIAHDTAGGRAAAGTARRARGTARRVQGRAAATRAARTAQQRREATTARRGAEARRRAERDARVAAKEAQLDEIIDQYQQTPADRAEQRAAYRQARKPRSYPGPAEGWRAPRRPHRPSNESPGSLHIFPDGSTF